MPLVSVSSYGPVLTRFLAHWESVDAELAEPLVTKSGGRAVGLALRAELEARVLAVLRARLTLRWERSGVLAGRAALRRRQEQFNTMVRGYWEGTPWESLVQPLPEVEVALDRFLKPCRRALRLWEALEGEPLPPGAPTPLRIGGTVTRAAYAAEVEELRLAGLAVEAADFALALARTRRNETVAAIRAMLISYTKALPGRVEAGDVLLVAMPRLWPLPGHTPDRVTATGTWAEDRTRLEWAESEEKLLERYEIRACAGEEYEREEETTLATVPAGGPRTWESTEWPAAAGETACFRIYVVLSTGNERGSATVRVTRPG